MRERHTRAATPRRFHWDWLFSVPLSALFGVVVFASGLALHDGQKQRVAEGEIGEQTEEPPPIPTNWLADFPARVGRVTTALAKLPLHLPAPSEEPQGADNVRWIHRRYEVLVPTAQAAAESLRGFEPLRDAAPGVTLRVSEHPTSVQVQVGVDGLLTHTVALQWARHHPRVAIIVDNLGSNLLVARELATLDAALTLAVQPLEPFAREVAELANLYQRQVLVHLPEPVPAARGGGVIDQAAVLRSLNDSLASIPRAVGVTDDREGGPLSNPVQARWVLERLKEDALFFIDGVTDPSNVACDVAGELTLPCGKASMVVHETQDEQAISTQFEKLRQIAQARGNALVILRAGPATVTALRAALTDLTAAGIEIVPASSIIFDRFLSPG
ncbi:divergent polysaccharide deacetylase family protein [Candidatus Binatia bacterium]|nr:divergent polysaccharide deacetylase family protein [Candidatus Binatia bacterium]